MLFATLPVLHCQTCSDCSVTDGVYACLDEVSYGICFNLGAVDTNTIRSCKDGYYCNVDGSFCSPQETSAPSCVTSTTPSPSSTPVLSTCSDCSLTDGVYACVDETSYGVCYNLGFVDQSAIRSCDDGFYCNVDGTFCSSQDTSSPSCVLTTTPESTTESTTTSVPEIDADAYCLSLNKEGYFRVESDPTCKDYVNCFKLSGDTLGWLFHCNTDEYFNSETTQCETERPADC